MDRVEDSFKGATRAFEAANQITLDWFVEAKKRIRSVDSNMESNHKKLQGLQEQANSSVTEISGCKAGIEVHGDRITQLEEKLQEVQYSIWTLRQQVENLGA